MVNYDYWWQVVLAFLPCYDVNTQLLLWGIAPALFQWSWWGWQSQLSCPSPSLDEHMVQAWSISLSLIFEQKWDILSFHTFHWYWTNINLELLVGQLLQLHGRSLFSVVGKRPTRRGMHRGDSVRGKRGKMEKGEGDLT